MAGTLWVDTLPNMTIAAGTQINIDLLDTLAQSRVDRMTLLRTVIGLDIARLTHDSGEGSQQVFIGIGQVADTIPLGGADMPDPFVMTEFPSRGWLWRAAYRVYGFAADQPAVFNARIDLDLRAKRKLENGRMVMMARNTPFEGVDTVVTVSGVVRQLWMLT